MLCKHTNVKLCVGTLTLPPGPGLAVDAVVPDADHQALLEDSVAKVTLMPEYLVVCCWRSIKEVSLLLGQLCQTAPLIGVGDQAGLLSLSQVSYLWGEKGGTRWDCCHCRS